MTTSTVSLHPTFLRSGFAAALPVGALSLWNVGARAAELDPITVAPPIIKTVGHDLVTQAPIDDVTVNAQIAVDTETLRNESGVVLLKDRVLEAAHKVCDTGEPFLQDDSSCVRDAVKAAQPQVDAAIASARSNTTMQ